jgi:8-oxo-dGTP pyrophosphatase MutT (NUDIX family)
VVCAQGHRHWGVYGAAGLLVVAPDGPSVLLQHRAPWSHSGDTWGVPGGAMHRHETQQQAALRETVEETRLDVRRLTMTVQHVDDHQSWSYTTIVASAPSQLPVVPERESSALRWVPVDEVDQLPLHPAFRLAWPALLRLLPATRP